MTPPTCTLDGCNQPHVARGLCATHYRSARYHGTLPDRAPRTPHAAVTVIARQWGIPVTDILSPSRQAEHVEVRRACIHALRDLGLTLRQIGDILGGRDHNTVRNALRHDRPTPPDQPGQIPSGCHVPGCDRTPKHDGMAFCAGHDRRWRRTGDVDPDRPLRPIRVDGPILDLEVHDRTGYRNGCRCETCRQDAVRSVKRNRHRPQSRPAKAGADAVQQLVDQGMTVAAIAREAGLTRGTLDRWLKGKGTARQPSIDKVLAVEPPAPPVPTCEDCDEPGWDGGRWCWTHYSARAKRTPATGCGTDAGYTRHRRAGTEACQACRDAHHQAQLLRRAS